MIFIRKSRGVGKVLKLVTCFAIPLQTIDLSFIFANVGVGGGSQNWSLFVNVINI